MAPALFARLRVRVEDCHNSDVYSAAVLGSILVVQDFEAGNLYIFEILSLNWFQILNTLAAKAATQVFRPISILPVMLVCLGVDLSISTQRNKSAWQHKATRMCLLRTKYGMCHLKPCS